MNYEQSEILHLQSELRRAKEEIRNLEAQLTVEEDRHHRTKHERDEYKGRCDRSYDAYVTDPHEGYIPQSDVDELYEDIAHLTDENAALKAQNTRLTAALQPFAEMGKVTDPIERYEGLPIYGYTGTTIYGNGPVITRADFERARALLADLDAKAEDES